MSQSPEDQAIRFSGSPGLHLPRAVSALGAVAKAAPLIGDHARPAGAPVRIWAMRVRRAPHFGAKPLSMRSDARAPSGRQSIDRPLPVFVGRFDRDVEMTVKTISKWCGTNSKKIALPRSRRGAEQHRAHPALREPTWLAGPAGYVSIGARLPASKLIERARRFNGYAGNHISREPTHRAQSPRVHVRSPRKVRAGCLSDTPERTRKSPSPGESGASGRKAPLGEKTRRARRTAENAEKGRRAVISKKGSLGELLPLLESCPSGQNRRRGSSSPFFFSAPCGW